MLKTLMEMRGYQLRAIDKDLGSVDDFYFDDRLWRIRYLVADTGNWLPGRNVLIGQEALERSEWEDKVFPVTLTSAEINDSPGIETDLPFSLQKEKELRQFFKWREYWDDDVFIQPAGFTPMGVPGGEAMEQSLKQGMNSPGKLDGNPHLRSANEVQGYYIGAQDGEIGHVDDFIVEDTSWDIRYLVVDTQNWLPGKKVLISRKWVSAIDWNKQTVQVNMNRDMIEQSPEYDPNKPINREYEVRMYDFYGKPHDWE
ncbi:MAG: PRC-barrel domain-containing protein [Nitrospirales bacterium]|nr:PRC-barrel domain-containing protein [Nitrospirales bacterium]